MEVGKRAGSLQPECVHFHDRKKTCPEQKTSHSGLDFQAVSGRNDLPFMC